MPTSSIQLQSGCGSLLQDLLGDVYVTKVEQPKTPLEQAQQQMAQYQSEPSIGLNFPPLQWWKAHAYKFPLVPRLAKSLFCVPATSVPSERVFSTAGDIVTQQRANLKSKHVDVLIFLKKNLQ